MNLYSVMFRDADGHVAITALHEESITAATETAQLFYPDYGELVKVERIA